MNKRITTFFLTALICLLGTSTWALEQDANGVYQISTSEDMLEFANLVNEGEVTASAVLLTDITVTFPDNVMIGVNGKDYKGIFDGQEHKITVTINRSADGCGLFANIAAGGKVCNLIVDGSINGTTGVGSFAWQNFGTLENCVSLATVRGTGGYSAGITCASVGSAVFKNCIFAGTIECGTSGNVAGFNWWTNGGNPSYVNCACIPISVSAGGYSAWCQQPGNGSYLNCYYTDVNGTNNAGNATLIDNAAITSGELCFKLNGDQSIIQWTQTLGVDEIPYPFTTHGTIVLNEDGSYGNITGIDVVQTSESRVHDEMYDLSGRKVANGKIMKGVYIVNRKKIFIK